MKKTILLLHLFLLFFLRGITQPLSAYVNQDGRFFVFDNFEIHQAHYLEPKYFLIGKNSIPFIDNTKNFKIYYNGNTQQINEGYTTDFYITDNLTVFKNQATLCVFDNGKFKKLADYNTSFAYSDSVIGFFDDQKYQYNLYWNGKIIQLEENSLGNPVTMTAAGSNVFAWVTQYDQFNIFFNGDIFEQESQAPQMVSAGKNIVVYRDYYNDLKVFYKGETFDLGAVPVIAGKQKMSSVLAGNDLAAYLDGTGELKIFYSGKIIETGVMNPQLIRVKDNVMIFEDGTGGLSVFYMGQITRLENFIPMKMELSQNSLYYFTQTNEIRFFTFGKMVELPVQIYNDIRLDFDVLQLKTGFNSFSFYYQNKKL